MNGLAMREKEKCPGLRGLTPNSAGYPKNLLSPRALVSADLCVIGDPGLLSRSTIGLVSSKRLPGRLVREAHDWAEQMKNGPRVIAGGFHSPMERECFNVFLTGSAFLVVCPARGIGRMRIPAEWTDRIAVGRMAVVSAIEPGLRRTTENLAARRNALVASLADAVLVVYASPGSATERLVREVSRRGKPLLTFGGPENDRLIRLGASVVDWGP
jgi:predicted Rossmann fold nucleotide-binding protein DprA/Smf involved in DNA uptake